MLVTIKDINNQDHCLNIEGITSNSSKVQSGFIFVCIEGSKHDGHDYLEEAFKRGALAAITSRDVDTSYQYFKVKNTRRALADISNQYYENPSDKLSMVGITGTDGKTTTATIVKHLLDRLDSPSGYIGTNGYEYLDNKGKTSLTTPEIDALLPLIAKMHKSGVNTVSMEVSSHALSLQRVAGLKYRVAALTNISRDHLDFHRSMEEYAKSKVILFDSLHNNGWGVINGDTQYSQLFIAKAKSLGNNYLTYGLSRDNNIFASNIKITRTGSTFDITYNNQSIRVSTQLLGKFNIYNLLCATSILVCLGHSLMDICKHIPTIAYIDGRMHIIQDKHPSTIIIDYAHTENALDKLFNYVDRIAKDNKVYIVLGSPGERDTEKRPLIGRLVTKRAHRVFFTTQDPRSEDPSTIARQLSSLAHRENYEIVLDRGIAIDRALDLGKKGDIILITGKGNEKSHQLKHTKLKFCDIDYVIEKLGKG